MAPRFWLLRISNIATAAVRADRDTSPTSGERAVLLGSRSCVLAAAAALSRILFELEATRIWPRVLRSFALRELLS
jgi:hypothetical protein